MTPAAGALPPTAMIILLAAALGAARAVPVTLLVPAFGGRHVAAPARVGLGLLLALLGWPRIAAGLHGDGGGVAALAQGGAAAALLLLAAREVLVGVTVGLVAACAFRAAEAAGRLADLARAPQAAATDADADAGGPTGQLYLLLATVIFLELGGLGRLAAALARSYDAVPLGPGPALRAGLDGAAAVVTLASARLIEAALGLAAPVIVALWLADLALGAVARLAPRLPLHVAALPGRALLGAGVLLLGLGSLDAALAGGLAGWMQLVERAFAVWK
jgi:flagellar biosynthetic protein FliR